MTHSFSKTDFYFKTSHFQNFQDYHPIPKHIFNSWKKSPFLHHLKLYWQRWLCLKLEKNRVSYFYNVNIFNHLSLFHSCCCYPVSSFKFPTFSQLACFHFRKYLEVIIFSWENWIYSIYFLIDRNCFYIVKNSSS